MYISSMLVGLLNFTVQNDMHNVRKMKMTVMGSFRGAFVGPYGILFNLGISFHSYWLKFRSFTHLGIHNGGVH